MPKSLKKTRKLISRKKGDITALHENSRDSIRLRRALMRDDKLVSVASARRKNDQPLLVRAAYFQEAVRNNEGEPLEMDAIQELISTFVHQHDEEIATLKKERRAGQPASTRQDLLGIKIAADLKEYETGFWAEAKPSRLAESREALKKKSLEKLKLSSIITSLQPINTIPQQLLHTTITSLTMLSIRSIARSAPRAISRLALTSTRQPSTLRSISRLPSAFSSTPLQSQFSRAAFSTTVRRSKHEGDEELIQKLESEIQAEDQMKEADGIPTSVKEFLENGPFEIVDTPGQEDVVLTRTFGDEKIRITFSIADLNAIDPDEQYTDRAIEDEEDLDQSSSKAPENTLEGEESEGEHDSEEPTSFPARLNIVIEKASKGAMAVEAICEEGVIVVDNVYYYADAAHAYAKTAEVAHKRQDLYVGPPFGNLDEDLQVLLERYLDERGINGTLAVFVPDYIDVKEQKEYLQWLENVKSFVEA